MSKEQSKDSVRLIDIVPKPGPDSKYLIEEINKLYKELLNEQRNGLK